MWNDRCVPKEAEHRMLFCSGKSTLGHTFFVNYDCDHLPKSVRKRLLEQTTKMMNFVLINCYDQHAVRLQKLPRKPDALIHERKPFAVSPRIIEIDVVIVVTPVFRSCIVRWVDIDYVHFSRVRITERL